MKLPSIRQTSMLAFLACMALIVFALFLEIYVKLTPCPLCIVQRVIIMLLGLLFLVGALFNFQYKSQKVFYLVIFLLALFGVVVSGRHVWITLLPPDQVPACGANLSYLFQILPLTQIVKLVFLGSGDCAKVTWRFLSLSIPEWTLLSFIFFALLSLWQSYREDN